jgi:hypothetical protein
MANIIPSQAIENRIYLIRAKKVMLDWDLAELYGVETGQLNRAVKRNAARFPEDFMFELTKPKFENLKCQIGISSWGGARWLPKAFTEQGVAMLSSVLNSERAIQVNIQIIRTFTRLRQMLSSHEELRVKVEAMEKKYDNQFRVVFTAIKQLLEPPSAPANRRKIGFVG